MDHTLALIGRIHQGDKRGKEILCFSEKYGDWCIVLPGVFWGEGWKWRTFFKLEASGF